MNGVSTGLKGLRLGISGFVVAEDQSLEARALRKVYRTKAVALEGKERIGNLLGIQVAAVTSGIVAIAVRILAKSASLRIMSPERKTVVVAPAQSPVEISNVVSPAPEQLPPAPESARIRQLLGRSAFRVAKLWGDARGSDRLRDCAALVWFVARKLGRMVALAPRGLQLAAVGGCALLLAPWPQFLTHTDTATPAPVAFVAVPPAKARENGPVWTTVAAPIPSYNLESPELERVTPRYKAQRHSDGARQDIMLFGDIAAAATGPKARPVGSVSVEIHPDALAGVLPDTLFVDAARRAAFAGASIERVASSTGITSKFGTFEVADATIATESGPRGCLVFRHAAQSLSLQIHGWFCGTAARPVDRASLSCILDRIDLLGAGEDMALKAYFAGVERSRKPCGGHKMIGAKATWLDPAGKMPVLKAAISDRQKPRIVSLN